MARIGSKGPSLVRDFDANLETYQVGAHFEALDEDVLPVPLDLRYTQVGFNLVSVQVCVLLIETMVIKETMDFFPIISKRNDGFGPKRWNFYELKVNRNVTSIRQVRVSGWRPPNCISFIFQRP